MASISSVAPGTSPPAILSNDLYLEGPGAMTPILDSSDNLVTRTITGLVAGDRPKFYMVTAGGPHHYLDEVNWSYEYRPGTGLWRLTYEDGGGGPMPPALDPDTQLDACFNLDLGDPAVTDIKPWPEPATPPPGEGQEWTVWDPDMVLVATLTDKQKASFRAEKNGTGSGQFTINRYSPNATPDILHDGNLVKVTIPRIDPDPIFGFFLENPETVLASLDEKGDETKTITGRGALSYIARGIWLAESFVVPWWPATMDDPPSNARGAVIVKAGTYYHFNVAGGVIDGAAVDGDGWTRFATSGFKAYFDTRRTYLWPDENSKRFLVHLITTEDPSSPDYTGFYFHPHQDGVTEILKSATPNSVNDTIPLTDIGDGDKPGQVLYRIWQEAVAAARPIHETPLWTVDFTDTEDSDGNPWTVTDALKGVTADLGEDWLTTVGKLMATGALDVVMSPDLVMSAYNHYGRDLTGDDFGPGVVRFVTGVNIADRLARERNPGPTPTWTQVIGTDGVVTSAELPDAASRIPRSTSTRGDTNDEAALEALGLAELQRQLIQSDATAFRSRTDADDEETGRYLPGPAGTVHGKYWFGDLVRLHTGTEEEDFNEAEDEIAAITIAEGEARDLEVTNELGSALEPASREIRPAGAWRGDAGGISAGPLTGGAGIGAVTSSTDTTGSTEPAIQDHGGLLGLGDDDHPEYAQVHVAASTDPVVTDDEGDGWREGARWINLATGEEFVLVDATVGAAVWTSTTDAGVGGSGTTVIVPLVNKSGASVAAGDVVVISAANAGAFTTTTVAQSPVQIGVAQATIANNATGDVAISGYVAAVNTNGSTFGLRTFLETNGSAKQSTANTTQRTGSFGVVLGTGANPPAILFGATTLLPTLHAAQHQAGGSDAIKLDDLAAPDDNTELDATTSAHGLLRKLPGGTTTYLRADGTFATPSTGGGGSAADAITGQPGVGGAVISGLQASPDVVPTSPGSGDDEFDATDTSDPMTGWTTLGTLDGLNTNSTFKSHLYMKKNATSAVRVDGIYRAKSPAFTVTAKVTATNIFANFQRAGIFIGEASPGKIYTLAGISASGFKIEILSMTNPTTFSGTTVAVSGFIAQVALYLRIIVASSTDCTFQWSLDGLFFVTLLANANPGFTVGSAGLFLNPQNASFGVESADDWIRFS